MKLFSKIAGAFLISTLPLSAIAMDNSVCDMELFEKLKVAKKTGMKPPKRTPGEILRFYMDEYEVLCPWQVELDINHDGKKDWVGILENQGEYALMAFLSNRLKYTSIKIKSYTRFPADTFLSFERKNKTFKTENDISRNTNRDSFAENDLKGKSTLFAWEDNQISPVLEFVHDRSQLAVSDKPMLD